MKIFVTGATGVIGRRAVPRMIAEGHSVTAVGRSPERSAQLRQAGATVLAIDLFDERSVARAMEGHETVVNLATHMPSSPTKMLLPWAWKENDRVRRDGSALLAVTAARVGATRFIQESFAPIYEDQGDRWIDESSPVRPASYNRSTLDAEHAAEGFTSAGGAGVVLRFGALYGPDQMMASMAGMVRKGWAPLPGSPSAFVSLIAQDDAAGAVSASLHVPPGTYNVVDDQPVRRKEYFELLAHLLGVRPPKPLPSMVTALMGGAGELLSRSQRISNGKLHAAANWALRYPGVRDGLPVVLAQLRDS